MRTKPYLLVDVDGVLAPFGDGPKPAGFDRHVLGSYEVWLNLDHGIWLNALAEEFELVWATGWEHRAARLIAPVLDLPPMEVIEFSREPAWDVSWKLPDVVGFVGDEPTAWIDDDLGARAHEWAQDRSSPTLLIDIERTEGLRPQHVQVLTEFGHSLWSRRY